MVRGTPPIHSNRRRHTPTHATHTPPQALAEPTLLEEDFLADLDDEEEEEKGGGEGGGTGAAPAMGEPGQVSGPPAQATAEATTTGEGESVHTGYSSTPSAASVQPTASASAQGSEQAAEGGGAISAPSSAGARLRSIKAIRSSSEYQAQLREIRDRLAAGNVGHALSKPLELDPTYRAMVAANATMHAMQEEVLALHRFIADVYADKFPELEQIVPDVVKFVNTVRIIGNETDMASLAEALGEVLPQSVVMVITITGSASATGTLPAADLQAVCEACDEVQALLAEKGAFLRFIESFMAVVAPNVTAILGHTIAAQLIGIAGGLVALSRIPGSTVQVLGQERKALGGQSARAASLHRGVVYGAPVVGTAPPDLRLKAGKLVANKVVLAARVDSMQGAPDGSVGQKYVAEIASELERRQAPPPSRTVKPRPRPDDKPSRKRGGRRYRALKERLGLTAVRKAANRLSTSESAAEYGDVAMGMDRGMLNQDVGGGVRVKAANQKILKKRRVDAGAASAATHGLASTIAFTPVQGMELVNPDAAAERVKAANAKYFGSGSFSTVPSAGAGK